MMIGKRIFVSGGAGVIGLELVPKLVARGAELLVGDLRGRPSIFPKSVIYRQGDLNQISERELLQFKPDIFIHLAATFERSDESYAFWEENFWHNIRLSHHLMTLLKDIPSLKRVVFASSYLIYEPSLYQFPLPQEIPTSLQETDPVRPRNLTGMAKFAHEIELRYIDQFKSNQFSTVCARIYRGYGKNSRDIISRWVRSLLNEESITVYRSEGIFDYIYASDSAEGLVRLAAEPNVSGIINLGTGRSRSVNDVIGILRQHFPNMRHKESEVDMPYEASQANMSKFNKLLNWLPLYDLEKAIPEIIDFEKTQIQNINSNQERMTPIILVSSASRKVPLITAMKSAARRVDVHARVVAGDLDSGVLSSYVADEFWAMPPICDENLDMVVDGCKLRGINVVFPTRDGELLFWAKHADHFSKFGINVICSSTTSLIQAIDKLSFSEYCLEHELPVIPASIQLNSIDADRFVVKERYGAGSRAIGLNLNSQDAITHASTLTSPIFQPYVEGVEFSVDAWCDKNHKVKGLILRRRDIVINGESQVTTTFSNPEIELQLKCVIENLKLRGPLVLQAIQDKENTIHIIECNARFGGASTTGIAAGVDSLFWSILEAQGADVDLYPFIRSESEIRQIRVPSDIYIHDPNI